MTMLILPRTITKHLGRRQLAMASLMTLAPCFSLNAFSILLAAYYSFLRLISSSHRGILWWVYTSIHRFFWPFWLFSFFFKLIFAGLHFMTSNYFPCMMIQSCLFRVISARQIEWDLWSRWWIGFSSSLFWSIFSGLWATLYICRMDRQNHISLRGALHTVWHLDRGICCEMLRSFASLGKRLTIIEHDFYQPAVRLVWG